MLGPWSEGSLAEPKLMLKQTSEAMVLMVPKAGADLQPKYEVETLMKCW